MSMRIFLLKGSSAIIVLFVLQVCPYPVLDGFYQNFEVFVYFPHNSNNSKSWQLLRKFLGLPRFLPGAHGREAEILPLSLAAPCKTKILYENQWMAHNKTIDKIIFLAAYDNGGRRATNQ